MVFSVASWVLVLSLTSPAWPAPAPATTAQPLGSVPFSSPGDRLLETEGLFEGDILLPKGHSEDRGVVTKDVRLWPKGVIPYVIKPRTAGDIKKIRDGMTSIEALSCLRFVERTTEDDYIFIDFSKGSFIGRQGGKQVLSLEKGCLAKATVMHELLHAAGFYHEHSRSDRDDYVVIFPENVKEGKMRNFNKRKPSENRLLTPFDLESVMLYGSETFSRAPGLATILTKDGKRLPETHDKKSLSASDTRRIRMLYKCRN
ncbi:astacin-like metalloprotease toxin 5 isoform X2 [Amblyomma americanum]